MLRQALLIETKWNNGLATELSRAFYFFLGSFNVH